MPNIIKITDLKSPQLEVYTIRSEVQLLHYFEPKEGIFIAESPKVDEICGNAKRIAVLEDVVNPTNLGAIFRSAAALNVDAILLTPACTDPLYRRAARVSMGTVFQIPWTISKNVYEEIKRLGFKTAAMALTHRSISLSDPAPANEEKLAIILGTEGEGLKPETIAMCDYTIRIPMRENVDSLNVAAASAVAFWELCKH